MLQLDTDVIVVGNGPAGIALSAFLSGWHPHYNTAQPHPNPHVHKRLRDTSSLLLDLNFDELDFIDEQQRNPNVGLFSDFYDSLMRPEPAVDALSSSTRRPCLQYTYTPSCAVPHLVLGEERIGGSWNNYDDSMKTVSLSNWMDLPVYSLAEWLGSQLLLARLPAGIIRSYMQSYVKHLNLQNNFKECTSVTNITKLCCDLTQAEYWRIQGHYANGQSFELTCKRVVLACGRKRHRTLEVEGEMNAMNVVYNVCAMKQLFQQQADLNRAHVDDEVDFKSRAVVVVGDGISAADAITHCLANQIPVMHVFKRTEKQLKSTMLSRLSSTIYPEYSKIFDLMLERTQHSCYRRAPSTSVNAIYPDSTTVLRHADGSEERVAYRCLVICVGLQTELSMLEDKHEFDSNYQSRQDPSLCAIGSVVGDHFIRYLIGGAFRVAQHLVREALYVDHRLLHLPPRLQCFDYHLQDLKTDEVLQLGSTDNIDVNNNGMEETTKVSERTVNRCFIPRIFCKLLS